MVDRNGKAVTGKGNRENLNFFLQNLSLLTFSLEQIMLPNRTKMFYLATF